MSGMRRAIASRLQTSKQQSPHFRLSVDLDLERLLALRQDINREIPGVKISVNDLLVKACATALVAVPDVNIQFDEAAQSIRRFTDADISVAVALPAGLITPIVRSANRKSISDISNEIHSLVTRAKAGTLKPEEFGAGPLACQIWGCSASGSLTPSSIHRKRNPRHWRRRGPGGSTRRANRRAPANDGIAILRSPGHRWRGRCGFSPGTQATD